MRNTLREIAARADAYFDESDKALSSSHEGPYAQYSDNRADYWAKLPEDVQDQGRKLLADSLALAGKIADASRTAALTTQEDTADIRVATKELRAAVRLRKYEYSPPEVIHDEDRVLGIRPASQSENEALSPARASRNFKECLYQLSEVLRLIENSASSPLKAAEAGELQAPATQRIKPGTAFIMMWMDPKQPELVDVMDKVKDIFSRFGVRAIRADDIEHDGLISERVLIEIRTAEFLFADLTGERPNVYYEVGYAHALGKRVILFRKSGTGVHFDLSGHNCPEYGNLRDLDAKLTRRLIDVTNINPGPGVEI